VPAKPSRTIVSIYYTGGRLQWIKTWNNFMSLNNIQLKDQVVFELYRDNLLATESTGQRPPLRTETAPAATAPVPPAPQVTAAPAKPVAPTPPATPRTPAPPPAARPAEQTPSGYKILGKNLRKITIIVHSPGIAFLADDELNVLTRMLEACRMNIGDVAIVNHASTPVAVAALKQQLQPSFILLFGPTPPDIGLPMDFPVFKIQPYDQCTYLTAPSLQELVKPGDESKLLKSKLWVCLKTLFEI
jgi:hypothetical protein